MAVDPVIQELMDLIEPPDNGDQARPTSDFGAGRTTGSNPHGGFDENRGHNVQPHGRVTSPVYGVVTEVDPKKLGRIVIEEWDPVSKKPTGYHVEILHTQTQTVKPGDKVEPTKQIGTQGDVGAPGNFHAHIQVYHGDRTPLNPLRHLYEYHHPGEPIPPLPQLEPQQVPPRLQRGSAPQPGDQRQIAPSAAPPSGSTPHSAAPSPLPPGKAIPGAVDPTSTGGPSGPTPLMPPANSAAPAPRPAPLATPSVPPPHFAPETPQNFGPFTAQSRFDTSGGLSAVKKPGGLPGMMIDAGLIPNWQEVLSAAPLQARSSDSYQPFGTRREFEPVPASSSQPIYDTRSFAAPPDGSTNADDAKNVRVLRRFDLAPDGSWVAAPLPGSDQPQGAQASSLSSPDPVTSNPPPIFGFQDRAAGSDDDDDLFSRFIKPLLQQ